MRRAALSLPSEDQVMRLGAALTGVVLSASAALAADLAQEHMRTLGVICGASPHPHCGWCFGAVGLGLAGLTAFVLALRPRMLSKLRFVPDQGRA
ncbi:MAG: hypothetical protein JHD15_00955 [Phenylobacterium sp.]|uniref:hypothetical protein n=1 Tax=Phenylobacterium sp. TaxID=1871053 RepID=UPI001A2DC634|nr:hypothetical protein [Phenylobacterium sp.]MBJ7408923.1 hypothetical protein [Phenylobacterium sp.]